jgi:hypothetical protein
MIPFWEKILEIDRKNPLSKKILEIDRENPGFLRKRPPSKSGRRPCTWLSILGILANNIFRLIQ